MAQRGDEYTVSLKLPHLNWGDYRNETNRDVIHDEGYIPIPRKYAKEFDIFNSNNWGIICFMQVPLMGF